MRVLYLVRVCVFLCGAGRRSWRTRTTVLSEVAPSWSALFCATEICRFCPMTLQLIYFKMEYIESLLATSPMGTVLVSSACPCTWRETSEGRTCRQLRLCAPIRASRTLAPPTTAGLRRLRCWSMSTAARGASCGCTARCATGVPSTSVPQSYRALRMFWSTRSLKAGTTTLAPAWTMATGSKQRWWPTAVIPRTRRQRQSPGPVMQPTSPSPHAGMTSRCGIGRAPRLPELCQGTGTTADTHALCCALCAQMCRVAVFASRHASNVNLYKNVRRCETWTDSDHTSALNRAVQGIGAARCRDRATPPAEQMPGSAHSPP
eukprot:m.254879 g.254879  ORF g.254879 m.254879 type:complete len:319 (+) comp19607_c0_seq7:317-1273(+)